MNHPKKIDEIGTPSNFQHLSTGSNYDSEEKNIELNKLCVKNPHDPLCKKSTIDNLDSTTYAKRIKPGDVSIEQKNKLQSLNNKLIENEEAYNPLDYYQQLQRERQAVLNEIKNYINL